MSSWRESVRLDADEAHEQAREDMWHETAPEIADREDLEFLLGRASCRLPLDQRTSDATRVGACWMRGIDPYPEAERHAA